MLRDSEYRESDIRDRIVWPVEEQIERRGPPRAELRPAKNGQAASELVK